MFSVIWAAAAAALFCPDCLAVHISLSSGCIIYSILLGSLGAEICNGGQYMHSYIVTGIVHSSTSTRTMRAACSESGVYLKTASP